VDGALDRFHSTEKIFNYLSHILRNN